MIMVGNITRRREYDGSCINGWSGSDIQLEDGDTTGVSVYWGYAKGWPYEVVVSVLEGEHRKY